MEDKHFQLQIEGKNIDLVFSDWTEQANGSVLAKMGDTAVLVTAVMGEEDREGINFFPLLVNYEEKYYAAGKIYGSRFVRRESRPSETAILTSRVIDRTIRPLFSPLMRRDVQIVATCLSIDEENDPDVISIIAASIALGTSNIPWQGPVSAVRIGWSKNEGFIVNPTYEQREKLALEMIVAGPDGEINMLDGKGNEIPEDIVKQALVLAQGIIQKINNQQKVIIEKIGKKKEEVVVHQFNTDIQKEMRAFLGGKLEEAIYQTGKQDREKSLALLEQSLYQHLKEKGFTDDSLQETDLIFQEEINQIVHRNVIEKERRPDGRKLDEVRPLKMQIDLFSRLHGSALFERGVTHILSVVTLGSPEDVLTMQGMETSGEKRFMHHYNFPGYSAGEVAPPRSPGRREIGHGALGEKALRPLIPPKEEFPYTIRVVSEVLSSNGSTSQGAICASSLALMAAGVPIKRHIAGIAMGLMSNDTGKYKILTDIQGPEDHHGDMDFKVAGTREGVTAIQMDVKVKGVTPQLLSEALDKAQAARFLILDKMEQTIASPRPELSPYAPRIYTIHIQPDKIGELIGPGGKVIQQITRDTGVDIDIQEDGTVFVTAPDKESADKALSQIKGITKNITSGEILEGKVVQIREFGAIIDLGHHKEGLLHISELAPYHVRRVEDVVHKGETLQVRVKKAEPNGRISLTLKGTEKYSKREKN